MASDFSLNGLRPFALERYFAAYEFNPTVKYLGCCSDSEPLSMQYLVNLFDDDTRQRWESLILSYTESAGLTELRQEIAKRLYPSHNAANIFIAAPQEAVFLAMTALLAKGNKIVCMHPAYQSLYEIANGIGAEVLLWHSRNGPDGVATFDVEDLKNLVHGQNIKLIVINAPHNPTGWLPSLTEFEAIRECCTTSTYPGGAYLFSDEMYSGLEFNPAERLPTAVEFMPGGRSISLCGLSKSVGLPGLRIGWLTSSNLDFLAAIAKLKDYTTICSPAPSEILALGAIRNWDTLVDRQMEIIRANIELMNEYAAGQWRNVLDWKAPRAGTVAYPYLILPKNGVGIAELCRMLAEEHGVLLLPGTIYEDPLAEICPGKGRVRIGFGRKNFPEVIAALDKALREIGLLN